MLNATKSIPTFEPSNPLTFPNARDSTVRMTRLNVYLNDVILIRIVRPIYSYAY